jgi:hypothetical protein
MSHFAQLSCDILAQLEDAKVSRDARMLHVEGTLETARMQSDGVLRRGLARFSDAVDPDALAEELEAAGLWERHDDGWFIVDFLKHNRGSDEVELSQAAYRKRQERSRRHKLGDHTMCYRGKYCQFGEIEPPSLTTTRDKTRDKTRDNTPVQDTSLHSTTGAVYEVDELERRSSDGPSALKRLSATSDQVGVHVFVDYERTGVCQACDMPKSNKRHQHDIPTAIIRAARVLANHGAMSKATEDYNLGEACWEATAAHPDWAILLSTSYVGKDLRITWAELRIPTARLGIPDTELASEAGDEVHARWAAYSAPLIRQLDRMLTASLGEIGVDDDGELTITVLAGPKKPDITDDLPVLLGLVPIAYAQEFPASTGAASPPVEPS